MNFATFRSTQQLRRFRSETDMNRIYEYVLNLTARRAWGQPDPFGVWPIFKFVGRRAAHQTLIPPGEMHPHGGSSRHA